MYREALANLSPEELIALVLAQASQIETLTAQIEESTRRIAELEAKLGQPPKTLITRRCRRRAAPSRTSPSVVGSRGARGMRGGFAGSLTTRTGLSRRLPIAAPTARTA